MTVVRMEDFRPPPRDDAPWTVMQIEESTDGVTSMGMIESKLLATDPGINPQGLDNDPRHPVARDWTTTLATLPPGIGYYRVRFQDGTGNLSEYSDWVKSGLEAWVPALREVAVHIRNRTVERATNQFRGTFTDKTRPTEEEAWEAITIALDVEPTPDDSVAVGGGGTTGPAVSNDLIVPAGMNIYTKDGVWVRESANPQHNFPEQPGAVDWDTRF
jgi:hypothetical protein